ncbi:MAG: serine/threonine protein kinase [Alphaproteobacteria bacterium]|nr:serine/threonine protein kinase [Alphaproteobacteria bacterium]
MKSPGDRVGRFRIERMLGEGGIAQVYQVRHELLDTVHALKLLPVARRGMAKRLVQEGRIQAHLRHPNVVAVTDLVEEKGQIGLVMEFIEGYSLEECIREGGPMELTEAMDLFGQILSGVAAAHQAGVLHRDLKPANVLLTAEDDRVVAKVADFGIAKFSSSDEELRSGKNSPVGTPGYMAPEQISDASQADARSDVFALGAILYEMISGRRTFGGRSVSQVLTRTSEGRYTPLRERVPAVPEHIDDAVRKALQVRPEDRFQSCMALARALGIARHIVPLKTIPPTGDDTIPPTARAGATLPPTTRPPPRAPVKRPPTDPARPKATSTFDEYLASHPTLSPDPLTDETPAFNTASDFLDVEPVSLDGVGDSGETDPADAVDTWSPEDNEDGFGLPGADATPLAAPPPTRKPRVKTWKPPPSPEQSRSAISVSSDPEPLPPEPEPPTPAPEPPRPAPPMPAPPKPAPPPPRATPPLPVQPRPEPPRPAPEPPPRRTRPIGRDVSSAIAESLATSEVGSAPVVDASVDTPEPPPPPDEPARPDVGEALGNLARTLLLVAAPLLVLGVALLIVGWFGAGMVGEATERADRVGVQLDEMMGEQDDMVAEYKELVVLALQEPDDGPARSYNVEQVERRHEDLKSAAVGPARVEASRELADFMSLEIGKLPTFQDDAVQQRRRDLELELRALLDNHGQHQDALTEWHAQVEAPMGYIAVLLGLAEAPPQEAP